MLRHHREEDELSALSAALSRQASLAAAAAGAAAPSQPLSGAASLAAAASLPERDGLVPSAYVAGQQQRWMQQKLSACGWRRIDVDTRHRHAHAAIILRDSRFETQARDHWNFLLEQCSW